jgi:hypothetical protein
MHTPAVHHSPSTAPLSARTGGLRVSPWTAELIASLDWLRLSELLRAVAVNAGCQLGPSRVESDGMVQFAMLEQPSSGLPLRNLVRLLSWNGSCATPAVVQAMVTQLSRVREPTRGVIVAVGGASTTARLVAQQHHIELIDAERLAETLRSLQAEKSDFYYSLTTVGEYSRPTCPVCLRKLHRVLQPSAQHGGHLPRELVFQSSSLVSDMVVCDRLEVMRDCEVAFLKEVRAKMMIIRGHASGNFICDGPLILDPGATLSGTVAARSVRVHAGGELLGQARILEGSAESLMEPEASWFWRCESTAAACQKVIFDPHHPG